MRKGYQEVLKRMGALQSSFRWVPLSPAALAVVAALLLLSGCSIVWAAPAPGALAFLAATLIAWSTWGGYPYRSHAASPVALSPGPAAENANLPAATAVFLAGDGLALAAFSALLGNEILADAYRAAPYLVFEEGPSPRIDRDSGFRTAEHVVRGDGFSEPDAAEFVRVADKKRLNPKHGDPAAIDTGGGTFNTRCGTYCHGGQAIGGGCPSLIDEFWLHGDSDLEIYKVIAGGGGAGTRMGAFGGELSADQIWEIISYLRHRNKEFLLEKAGPKSFRERSAQCPSEVFLTVTLSGGRTAEGILVIEDKVSLMLEDRSEALSRQFRVEKDRVLDSKLKCLE